jgi:Bacterial regulatory helix-turn-helix protein, lysR family
LNPTRTAEHCHVTQRALTRAIQKLEEELGGLLFRRERHLTHLTDLGRLMQPQLEQIWRQAALTTTNRRELRRRSAIEATIGHMKADGRRDRNYLKGTAGDASKRHPLRRRPQPAADPGALGQASARPPPAARRARSQGRRRPSTGVESNSSGPIS